MIFSLSTYFKQTFWQLYKIILILDDLFLKYEGWKEGRGSIWLPREKLPSKSWGENSIVQVSKHYTSDWERARFGHTTFVEEPKILSTLAHCYSKGLWGRLDYVIILLSSHFVSVLFAFIFMKLTWKMKKHARERSVFTVSSPVWYIFIKKEENLILTIYKTEIALHKNEVFHLGFLQNMWPNPRFSFFLSFFVHCRSCTTTSLILSPMGS